MATGKVHMVSGRRGGATMLCGGSRGARSLVPAEVTCESCREALERETVVGAHLHALDAMQANGPREVVKAWLGVAVEKARAAVVRTEESLAMAKAEVEKLSRAYEEA